MHTWVFHSVVVWLIVLVAGLVGFAARAPTTVQRALALDVVAVVLVAVFTVLAMWRGEPGFMDIALVLAMLGFVQTVATVRLVERRKDLQ